MAASYRRLLLHGVSIGSRRSGNASKKWNKMEY
jgi:hypothetical protein